MSIDERQRHGLHEKLDAVLGTEHADTLMAALPPVGWADVATKQDLAHLDEVMGLRLDKGLAEVRTEIAQLRAEFHRDMRTQLWGIFGSVLVAVLVNQLVGRLL